MHVMLVIGQCNRVVLHFTELTSVFFFFFLRKHITMSSFSLIFFHSFD